MCVKQITGCEFSATNLNKFCTEMVLRFTVSVSLFILDQAAVVSVLLSVNKHIPQMSYICKCCVVVSM